LHYTNVFKKGTHTFSIRSNRANAFGCGTSWGDIDILVLPQKMVATTGGKKTTKKPANPCAKNNGGCNKLRKCMNSKGKAMCGKCPTGYTNLGAKNCKKAPTKFSYAGLNKVNCGKYKPVGTEAACKATAKDAKKAYGGTGTYAAWPKACFLYNNKFYFNKHNTGKANKQGNPVCTKTVDTKYSYGGAGKVNCGKYKPVGSEAACRATAKVAKKSFGGVGGWSNWPKDCFLYNNKFYYNRHNTGGSNKAGNPVCTKIVAPTMKCRPGSASNCKVSTIKTPGYSAGNILRIHNGRRVRKSTETDSCPTGYKVFSPRNKKDWTIVFNAMGKSINKYPKKPHFIIDVTRPANGCGGCTKYAMKSTTAQQGSWRTKDGSAWWLRDARYNEPNGDYHANCYLHIYDVNPNNVRFNDGNCGYYSTEYLCQKAMKTSSKGKTVVAYQTGDSRSGCPRSQGANSALITKRVAVKEDSYVVATGHMIRLYKGRADLHLRLNNAIKDYSLTYTPSRQWKDTQVYWVGSIKKGTHTFTLTGSRSNAFGCGPTWGDLDLMVIPKLSGVAVYQFGIPSGCPQTNLKFSKTITLPKDSVVYATGHIITRQKGGRADLYLRLNNGIRDYALSEDSTNQWVDLTVNNAVTLKKGRYTFSLTGSSNSKFGCGAGWGDLDLVVVPRFKGVAAYNQPDTKSGCPAKRAANTDLILKTIKVDQTSIIKITGHIIRTFGGRADAYLKYQRKHTLDTSLTYTNSKRWEDVKLHFTGTFGKGTHTFSIRANRANAFGCGTSWGDIDILVLPQKMG